MSAAANHDRYESAPVVRGKKGLSVKPRLCPRGDGSILVTLPCGTTRTIRTSTDCYGKTCYTIDGEYRFGKPEEFCVLRSALTHCVRACTLVLAPIEVSDPLALAKQADRSAADTCKIVRELLQARTGRTWSVTPGRGTGSSWIRISAPPKRRGEFGYLSIEDQILLHAALGESDPQGISVSPCRGERGSYVFLAAGVPIPAGWKISAPDWD